MLLTLPVELYEHICRFAQLGDLYSLLFTSRYRLWETERALYDTINLPYSGYPRGSYRDSIQSLLELLIRSPHHAHLVRVLHLPYITIDDSLAPLYSQAILMLPNLLHLTAEYGDEPCTPLIPLECTFQLRSLRCSEPLKELLDLLRVQQSLTRLEWFPMDERDLVPGHRHCRQRPINIPSLLGLESLSTHVNDARVFLPAALRLEELELGSRMHFVQDALEDVPVMPNLLKLVATRPGCSKAGLVAITRTFPHLRYLEFNPESGEMLVLAAERLTQLETLCFSSVGRDYDTYIMDAFNIRTSLHTVEFGDTKWTRDASQGVQCHRKTSTTLPQEKYDTIAGSGIDSPL